MGEFRKCEKLLGAVNSIRTTLHAYVRHSIGRHQCRLSGWNTTEPVLANGFWDCSSTCYFITGQGYIHWGQWPSLVETAWEDKQGLKDLSHVSHPVLRPVAKELKDLGGETEVTQFVYLERRRLRGDTISVYIFLKGDSQGGCVDLSLVTSNRI